VSTSTGWLANNDEGAADGAFENDCYRVRVS